MLRKTLKKAIKKCAHVFLRLIEGPPSQTGPLDRWAWAYTLNPTFVNLMEKEGCNHSYTWAGIQASNLAKNLGFDRVSFIEFGVAGGNGLLNLERLAEKLEVIFGIRINVYGFDSGTGLPRPQDYRDFPNLLSEKYFPMNIDTLKKQLIKAQLFLGPVEKTVSSFLETKPPPVAFVSFDLDLYSSTRDALKLFDAEQILLLPRVHCYFDDIFGYNNCEYV